MKKFLLTGLCALLVLGAGNAAATPGLFEVERVSVSFADLNIQNAAGARVLYARLQRAAEKVCDLDSYRQMGSLTRVSAANLCYAETLDNAVAKIDSDALRTIHSS